MPQRIWDQLTGVVGDKRLDPVIPHRLYVTAGCVQIRERDLVIAQPAVLDVGLVVVVGDGTVGMEVFFLVEGFEYTIVNGITCSVVTLNDSRQHL